MRSETKVLSNVWWPVRVGDEATEKALTVWLNSSVGLVDHSGPADQHTKAAGSP